jgi:UDP-hydrolysing UDP-N-acetyl-D-glucosamine 2-epimerase
VVTGGRADYGLFLPLLNLLRDDPANELQLIVTGMHLVPEQGETWRQIEEDGFTITEKVDIGVHNDSPTAISDAIANGVAGIAKSLERIQPDILVLLGDRFETLAAAIAATIARIPIAHIHGGEATEGLIDEPIRHSITKMAHLHFTATETYRQRVIQLGEQPERVFCVGALGLDNFRSLSLLSRTELEQVLGTQLRHPVFLVTYHPVTLETGSSAKHAADLIAALDNFTDASVIITLPNADTDNHNLRELLLKYAVENSSRVAAFPALGSLRYLSLMSVSDVLIGNSSSGLIEAPSVPVPTVNIGDRQRGRILPASVIQAEPDTPSIVNAITMALDTEFKNSLSEMRNPYGDGETAPRISEVITNYPLGPELVKKKFFDLPVGQVA